MTKSIYIYNTCIYTYMHVCICTRTGVFVTMLQHNVKSRLVELHHQSLITSQQNTHLHLQWLYSRRSGRGSQLHLPHWPPSSSSLYWSSLVSFPCFFSKADWLKKSGRGGASSGFGILHWLVFLQSLLLCWIY